MSSINANCQKLLRVGFDNHELFFPEGEVHIVVYDSYDLTNQKVQQVVLSKGFCPILSSTRIDGNLMFSVVPYAIPRIFNNIHIEEYLTVTEVKNIFASSIYSTNPQLEIRDRWIDQNMFRDMVSSSLSNGLSNLLRRSRQHEELPIVEIGSGRVYQFSNDLSIVRTQPHKIDCEDLSRSSSETVYQLSIGQLCDQLFDAEKHPPLFFALNVFDYLSKEERLSAIRNIYNLQKTGDSLLILLDTHPELNNMIEQLHEDYPKHAIFFYTKQSNENSKLTMMLVPSQYVNGKLSTTELLAMINEEAWNCANGVVSNIQKFLNSIYQNEDVHLISLEDYYVENICNDLKEIGYHTKVEYHVAFTVDQSPSGASLVQHDVIYKAVSDIFSVRQWSLNDSEFIRRLDDKEIQFPSKNNKEFLNFLKNTRKKVLGAEILEIKATK